MLMETRLKYKKLIFVNVDAFKIWITVGKGLPVLHRIFFSDIAIIWSVGWGHVVVRLIEALRYKS
jgi:hypothetical protein